MAGIEGSRFDDIDVIKGLIPGTSGVAPGYASVSAASIVSVRASTYTERTTANNLEVVSSSANDASAGTGSRTVRVTYYRSDGTGPFTSDVTMNGTTAVSIGDAACQFVEKLETLTVGSNGTNVGTITIRASGAGATVGTIVAGDGRTFWAHHYVATGRHSMIRRIVHGLFSNALLGTLTGSLFLRSQPPLTANSFEKQETMSLRSREGDSSWFYDFDRGLYVAGFSRVTLYVRPDAATAGTVQAGFTFLDL